MKPGIQLAITTLLLTTFQFASAATTITFESISTGSHPTVTSNGFEFSPVIYSSVIIRDTETHALQPRWGDTLRINKTDNSSFNLSSFDYQLQWPGASGTVQIFGYESNGNVLQDSFNYDRSTTRSTKNLNWSGLNSVEMVFQGTAQVDSFVISDNNEPPPTGDTIDFEELTPGSQPAITSQGMLFQPVYQSSLIIRDTETNALQPRWNDTMHVSKVDGSTFNLQSFDYRRQWPGLSGNVTVTGYQSNGVIVSNSFSYNRDTTTTTLSPGWMGLTHVEFGIQGSLQLDNFNIGSNDNPGTTYDYYVAANGDDDNPGSETQPFGSISYASTQAQPGDTVFIKAGVYRELVEIQGSGTPGNPITYLGETGTIVDGSTVDARGPGDENTDNLGLFTVSGKSYIILDGITVRNSNHHGININASNNKFTPISDLINIRDITIRNCRTNQTDGSGIIVYGTYPFVSYQVSDLTIDNNEVLRPQQGRFNGNNRWHEDITVGGGVENFSISNNHVDAYNTNPVLWDGGPLGIDAKDGVRNGEIHHNHVENIPSGGIYIDAGKDGANDISVYNNKVHDTTGYGIQISGEEGGAADTIDVFNNIIYNTRWSAIVVDSFTRGTPLPPPGPKTNIDIYNNTIFNTGFESSWSGGIRLDPHVTSGRVFNNIIATDTPLKADPNFQITNNCIFGNLDETGDTGLNPVIANPQFINPANLNFKLQASSPCIDAGISQGAPNTDFDDRTRPRGNGYDIGAFEF